MGRYLIFLLISVIFISCEEIVSVTDISSDQVRVLAPKNEAQLTTSAVNFSWFESLRARVKGRRDVRGENFPRERHRVVV